MTGRYAQFQPVYASLGVTAIPCSTSEKKPLVSHYQNMGIPASRQLAARFIDANALGIVCGARNRITVLDVDSTDRGVLKEALYRHGEPRIITRTASGKFHAYYLHTGEQRRIRPWKDLPIDVLGGGFVMAVPSLFRSGEYALEEGRIEDLRRLTPITGLDEIKRDRPKELPENRAKIKQGNRNNWLFAQCQRAAPHCENLEALLDIARTRNEECEPPMEDTEVVTIALNAWGMQQQGRNRMGQRGAFFTQDQITSMLSDPDAFLLLAFLRNSNGPNATFMCTNSLHEKFGWRRERFTSARSRLIEMGYIYQVRAASSYVGQPALYRWKD